MDDDDHPASCENGLRDGSNGHSTHEMAKGCPEPSSELSRGSAIPLVDQRRLWPFSKRATILCGGGLLSCAGGLSAYILTRPVREPDHFLLYHPPPPGQQWSRFVDTLVYQVSTLGSKIGYLGQPLLYILEKGFSSLEFLVDHSLMFFYAHTFSWVCILSPFAVIHLARMGWRKLTVPAADQRPPIASVEVSTSRCPGDNDSGASVTVSVSVDKGRLLRRLPSLLLAKTSSADSDASKEDQRPIDPLTAAPKPVLALALAGLVAAPLHWLSTYLFFASVRCEWGSSDLLARVWCGHTGLMVAGVVAFELGCGGIARVFTPDSYYRNSSED